MTEPGSLGALLEEIRACHACASDFDHDPRPVVRVRSETRILICGQAPGRRVHESGLPFDDPSGDRLRRWMGIDRTTFYDHPAIGVAAVAFCYPGTDRHGGDIPPPSRCAALWRRRLLAVLPRVELTLLVGRPAQAWALGADASMSETVRRWRDWLPDILVAPHPSWRNIAWLRRNPWFESEAAPWLQARVAGLLAA
ncbi:MAG TPA: uracil-DNA glycosylase family protein [Caulobacteraceae bacterium]|nr:uracil-DNA glycosylase family protein [Caulobacteraceae bacterium]